MNAPAWQTGAGRNAKLIQDSATINVMTGYVLSLGQGVVSLVFEMRLKTISGRVFVIRIGTMGSLLMLFVINMWENARAPVKGAMDLPITIA
jgi:hypothetical protein